MLYREIMAACSEIHTKRINRLWGKNVELFSVKPGGTYSDHWALKGYYTCKFSMYRAVNTLSVSYKNQSVNAV